MSTAPDDPQTPPFRPSPPLVIGLLGGVASGKSMVAARLAEHGLRVLDADREARRVTDRPEVRARIRERFGDRVLRGDGTLDRQRLAELVFGDAGARRDLEAITHPAIRAELEAQLAAARDEGVSVVLDVPLLLEGGLIERCDVCVFVEASPATRRARAEARGWSRDELERREAHQASLAVKKSRCAFTIDNDGCPGHTHRQVAELLSSIGSQG